MTTEIKKDGETMIPKQPNEGQDRPAFYSDHANFTPTWQDECICGHFGDSHTKYIDEYCCDSCQCLSFKRKDIAK